MKLAGDESDPRFVTTQSQAFTAKGWAVCRSPEFKQKGHQPVRLVATT